jgi:hypothetical protein
VRKKGPNFFRLKKEKKQVARFLQQVPAGQPKYKKGFKEIIYLHISTSPNLAKSCCRRSPFWLNHKIEKKKKKNPGHYVEKLQRINRYRAPTPVL